MPEDMLYNGTKVQWRGHGDFNATSGLPGHQNAAEQSHRDEGPIPEGLYSFPLAIGKDAQMVGPGQLDVRDGIEYVANEFHFHGDTYENGGWGPERVRLRIEHIDSPKNRHRNGFYLHDSTKGYSHGCIEVDRGFFAELRRMVALRKGHNSGPNRLYLRVKYPDAKAGTYGGTKAKVP